MDTQTQSQSDQNRKWAEEAFWTGHCHYLMQALALAMQRCQVWRLVKTGDVFTLIELFEFAKAYDTENPCRRDSSTAQPWRVPLACAWKWNT